MCSATTTTRTCHTATPRRAQGRARAQRTHLVGLPAHAPPCARAHTTMRPAARAHMATRIDHAVCARGAAATREQRWRCRGRCQVPHTTPRMWARHTMLSPRMSRPALNRLRGCGHILYLSLTHTMITAPPAPLAHVCVGRGCAYWRGLFALNHTRHNNHEWRGEDGLERHAARAMLCRQRR